MVIEDEDDIRSLLADVLQQAGFRVHAAGTGQEGVDLVRRVDPIVTTLDVNMPGMDGFATARSIRAISSTYIVILTARAEEIDALQGLEAGADDYVTKPFAPANCGPDRGAAAPFADAAARRAAADRTLGSPGGRRRSPAGTDWLEQNGLRLSIEMRLAVDGVALELTRSEFDILSELMSARRRVVGKGELALMLRGQRYTGSEVPQRQRFAGHRGAPWPTCAAS